MIPLPTTTIAKCNRIPVLSSALFVCIFAFAESAYSFGDSPNRSRSPVDLLLTNNETRILSVNQNADTLSLIDVASGKVLSEAPCGVRPNGIAISSDEKLVLITATYSGELLSFTNKADRLQPGKTLQLGFEPRGVAISPDSKKAYVALSTAAEIAVVDLEKFQVVHRIAVGRWPRFLALTSDGRRLAVGCNADGGVAVVDTQSNKQLYLEDFSGLNLGQMHISKDGLHVYFPWIVYRHNPITDVNIRRGWVLASRIARVRLDGPARREAIALDPRGKAVGDPLGMALSPDEQTLVCAASGTHELLVYKLPGLPFQDYGGPGDHIDDELLKDRTRFDRIPLGGRPLSVRYSKDGKTVYVANYLLNAIQVVNVPERKLTRTITLDDPTKTTLAQKGEAIFYDATRSLDQWYSCHSCHYEGHTNAVAMDTRNDGRFGNFKTVLTLRGSAETGPWFWHGREENFAAAVRKSMSDTMLGDEPTDADVEAISAFIKQMPAPVNLQGNSAPRNEAVVRGEAIFKSSKAGCARCHPAPNFTDGKKHDVGLGARDDMHRGYNPPTLRGIYDRAILLHDGRAKTLEEILRGPHNPAKVTGLGELSDQELSDLLAYLRTL